MIDLEERLETSAQSIRSRVDAAPVRPPSEIVRRHRRSRTLLAGAGFVTAFIAVAGVTALVTGARTVSSQPGSALESAYTYTLDLPGWEAGGVWESEDGSGLSHTLFGYEGNPDWSRRIEIKSGSVGTEFIAILRALGIEAVGSVLLGDTEGTVYLTGEHKCRLACATMVVTWPGPNGDDVVFLFEGIEVDEGTILLTHLKPLDAEQWQTVVDEYVPPVTTTTTAD